MACATPWTRARRSAWSTDGPLCRTPPALDDPRALRDLHPDVPDLPGDPEWRPCVASCGAAVHSRDPGRGAQAVGLRQADLHAVLDHDEEGLHAQGDLV